MKFSNYLIYKFQSATKNSLRTQSMKFSNYLIYKFQSELTAADIPLPTINEAYLADLKKTNISFSDDPQDRLYRAHGKILGLVHTDCPPLRSRHR